MTRPYIFPTLTGTDASYQFSDGSLFKLPPTLGGHTKIKSYLAQHKPGWSKVEFGYWIYTHKSSELGLVRFIGISPSDEPKAKDLRAHHPFTKRDFERYIHEIEQDAIQNRERIRDEISLLIHDLRRFSNSIYQNAVATKKAIYDGDSEEAATKIGNTIAAQAMLSIRTDILDFTEISNTILEEEKVPVYRKFDKVVRSFEPGCNLKNIDIYISGSSHSLTLGPDCVEIIAYILVDNALKYSPSNHRISVEVKEEEKDIRVRITSLGPIVSESEITEIFEKGFRGKAARALETNGTGYGLFLARSLALRFGGDIACRQFGDTVTTNRGEYRDTTFEVIFPIFEKHLTPVHSHTEKKGPPKKLNALKKDNSTPKDAKVSGHKKRNHRRRNRKSTPS